MLIDLPLTDEHWTYTDHLTPPLDWSQAPVARWFADGRLNVAYNCLDRHVLDGHGDQPAILWEG
ncbi:hypothetical protein IU436_31390, partial [Nocardia farcinica]|nr:hypothetical protein [Nocardia farcinica]